MSGELSLSPMACLGIGFLMSGAFVEALHDMERALTVIGAVTLATTQSGDGIYTLHRK